MSSLFSILWCSRLQSYILKKEKKLISRSSVNVHTCFFLTGITSLFSTLWNSFLQSKKKNWFRSLRWEFTHASLSPGLRAFSRPSGTAFSKVKKNWFWSLNLCLGGHFPFQPHTALQSNSKVLEITFTFSIQESRIIQPIIPQGDAEEMTRN